MELSCLNSSVIGERYFFPMRANVLDPVMVPASCGHLSCWRSDPGQGRPVLVHFHGNGEVVGDWIDSPITATVREAGWEVFYVEYRGYSASDGVPRLLDMLDDSPAILDAIGVPPRQIVVFGRSVGSIFAIDWIRRYPRTSGLILESGIFDVHERLSLRVTPAELGVSAAEFKQVCHARFDNERTLGMYANASLILHAEHDHLVDISHAERNARAATNAEFVRFARGDHNSILAANQAAYLQALSKFLQAQQ